MKCKDIKGKTPFCTSRQISDAAALPLLLSLSLNPTSIYSSLPSQNLLFQERDSRGGGNTRDSRKTKKGVEQEGKRERERESKRKLKREKIEKGRYYLHWAIELWGRKMRMEREQWRNSWKKCISNSGSVFSFSWVTIWTRHLIQFNVVSLWFLFLYPSFFNSWHIMLMYISWTKTEIPCLECGMEGSDEEERESGMKCENF